MALCVSEMQTILMGAWPFGGAGAARGARWECRYCARKSAGLRLKRWEAVRGVPQGEEMGIGAEMVGILRLIPSQGEEEDVPQT